MVGPPAFDLVYARLLLTHLSEPERAVAAFYSRLCRGSIVATEDLDFTDTSRNSNRRRSDGTMPCTVRLPRGEEPIRTSGRGCLVF